MILDIGGGPEYLSWKTIDIHPGASIQHDLDNIPWPIKDNSCVNMRMHHTLEHVKYPLDVMKEIFRIAGPNALLDIRVPWWKTDMYANPYHLHWFKPRWFEGLNPDSIVVPSMDTIMGEMNWKIVEANKIMGSRRFWKAYEYHVVLRAIK